MSKELLLISASREPYLGHCEKAIQDFLDDLTEKDIVAFVPYAKAEHDWDQYTKKAKAKFKELGFNLESVHQQDDPNEFLARNEVKAVFVGGGNTFRLLKKLYETGLIQTIPKLVEENGLRYIGASAGANVACPTIKTTNDMPIVQPPSFNAFGLIDLQINPHFVVGTLIPNHMGETRETRIAEFLEENSPPVLGLPETAWMTVTDKTCFFFGANPIAVFNEHGHHFLIPRGFDQPFFT